MSIKKSCDFCFKEFSDRDECVDSSLETVNLSGYDSGHRRYDACENCGRKINDFLEKMKNSKSKKDTKMAKKEIHKNDRTRGSRFFKMKKGRFI